VSLWNSLFANGRRLPVVFELWFVNCWQFCSCRRSAVQCGGLREWLMINDCLTCHIKEWLVYRPKNASDAGCAWLYARASPTLAGINSSINKTWPQRLAVWTHSAQATRNTQRYANLTATCIISTSRRQQSAITHCF